MILEPFYLEDDNNQEVFIRFDQIISIGRKKLEGRNIVYVYVADTHYQITKEAIVFNFERWLKECKDLTKVIFDAQNKPLGVLKMENKAK